LKYLTIINDYCEKFFKNYLIYYNKIIKVNKIYYIIDYAWPFKNKHFLLSQNKIIYLLLINLIIKMEFSTNEILGIGDWGLGIGPNPQSPIPNPQLIYV